MARILAIVDSFDAMVSVRPYRDRRSVRVTLETMRTEQYDGQWDSELLGYFLNMMWPLAEKGYKADA
jgi:HD-GYP domain-containing protein (c-di-GMP phosphodiesterase class II)